MEGDCKGSSVVDLGFLLLHFCISSEHNFPVDHTSPPQPPLAISSLRNVSKRLFPLQSCDPLDRGFSSFMNAPFVAEGTTVRYNWLHPTLLGPSMHYSQAMHKPDFCIKWHHFVHSSSLSVFCVCACETCSFQMQNI